MGTPVTPTKFATRDDYFAWTDAMIDVFDFFETSNTESAFCDHFAVPLFEARTELYDGRRLDTLEAAREFIDEMWPTPQEPPPKPVRRKNNLPDWWDHKTALADADWGPLTDYDEWLLHHQHMAPPTVCDRPLLPDGTAIITRDQCIADFADRLWNRGEPGYTTKDGRILASVEELCQFISDEHYPPETPEMLARQAKAALRGSTTPRWVLVEERAQRRWAPWSTEEIMDDGTVVHSLEEAREWADRTLGPDRVLCSVIDPRAGTYGPHGTYDRTKWKH